jgi:CheY-like chemotaxis protein
MASVIPPAGSGPGKRRILVIDDNIAIHRDFRKILCPETLSVELDDLDEAIFGAKAKPPHPLKSEFVVDAASQGQEGYEAVRRMLKLGRPYALLFVDMRMPPGWDGIETLEHIWTVCPDVEAVICSAYSDYSWHEVIRRLKRPGLRLLTKPFASKDVLEFAWTLTSRWLTAHAGELT